MGLNLLEKTELWVHGITLDSANLTDMAAAVAEVLELERDKILVVDVRPEHITFDVLERDIPQENIMGKEAAVLQALESISGVRLSREAYLHSNGILGLICAGTDDAESVLERVSRMTGEIREKLSKRVIIFPTGFELRQGLIEDTNTPYLKSLLEERGCSVAVGEIMEDDLGDILEKLDGALSCGYGLIITTGGVGAEDKDHTVEAVCHVDPQAATPYIVKFTQGTGRHVKDGVRIAVGQEGPSRLVCLPGPHDEVECAAPVLLQGLEEQWDKETLANALATVLADKWREKSSHPCHEHGWHGQDRKDGRNGS